MTEQKYKFDASKTKLGYGAVDIVVNMYTPEVIGRGIMPTDDNFKDKVRLEGDHRKGLTHEQYIEKMDRAGIERSLLIAIRCGDRRMSTSVEIPYEMIHEACQKYPHRYSGLAGIDPLRGIAGLKELDYAVKELGFVGAHLYPHWFGRKSNCSTKVSGRTSADTPLSIMFHNKAAQKNRILNNYGVAARLR